MGLVVGVRSGGAISHEQGLFCLLPCTLQGITRPILLT